MAFWTVICGLVLLVIVPFDVSVAVNVCVPTVLKVTLKLLVPETKGASAGNVGFGSLEEMSTVSVTFVSRFHEASTALTVTLNGAPLVCVAGAPVLPKEVPGAAVSPGVSNCNCTKAVARAVRFELATPGTVPSVAVMAVVSALNKVVANAVEDWPLVNTTEVV